MRVLSKSRFKLGLECPNKLYYTGKKNYANKKNENPFLEALAKGGFQVEELARLYYPGGHLLEGEDWDYVKHWNQTEELLKKENVIIYEAAFLFDGLFIRTDILVKKGNIIELIEVKSKSYEPDNENIFIGKRGGMDSKWKPYLFDVAFQKHVMQLCFPEWKIKSFIMMADKSKKASIDGLNQLFRITKSADNRTGVTVLAKSKDELGNPILGKLNITDIVTGIEIGKYAYADGLTFIDSIHDYKETYINDKYMNSPTSYSACNKCEFRTSDEDKKQGLKSGFVECFEKQNKWNDTDFKKTSLFDISGIHWTKSVKLFNNNSIFAESLNQDDIGFKEGVGKLSDSERAWIQIEKAINDDDSIYVDKVGLREEMNKWVFPLHFIDFETCTAALPFSKGRRPYEQIAFQFSHHTYYEDGEIEHSNQYISNKAAYFPNFDFIRELKKALEKDNGTIFRYHNHENTILNAIHVQLLKSDEKDKDSLIDFIESISHSTGNSAQKWQGERDMVDLWVIAKSFYFNPLTKGSNSLKDLLPAAINSSNFLKDKYSKPIDKISLTTTNFPTDFVWLVHDENKVINPYKRLPPVFDDWTEEEIEHSISDIEDINDGGAALTAYGKLQYTDMTTSEVEQITSALLKYCELDTLAMVMLYEHFKALIN
ncbi:DUF2779 domain-containing protein [Hyunsoonleella flava]|uniref:DUF2779 domain-containing protein n=1 Tax=Hyunsoonleella flava TaxID=2527939 RepID=A0A4V2JAG9_9FLAO|nr:DUF2779 domain-containing protein [Hyunsoonleella flava]TBN06696.1 DUF2779 domain-containing protein [Hyunsoonleella flava]